MKPVSNHLIRVFLVVCIAITYQNCNEILLGGTSGSGSVSNATSGEVLGLPTEADIDSNPLDSDAEIAPVSSIPLPENDGSENTLSSFLVISSPDQNGEIVFQVPESDLPEEQQTLANQTFAVYQIDPDESTDDGVTEEVALWKNIKSIWQSALQWMEAVVIESANALSIDLPTADAGTDNDELCLLEGVTCFTLNDKGHLDPINLQLTYVPDEANFKAPKFNIIPLSDDGNEEEFELESQTQMTFSSDVPASDSARVIDQNLKIMTFSNNRGNVKSIEPLGDRFVMKNGTFDDGYHFSTIPDIEEDQIIQNFTIEPVTQQFIFQSTNQISATDLDRSDHTLSDSGISSKSACTTNNNCSPSIMKNMVYTAPNGEMQSDIYYTTKAIENGLTIGAIHSLYEKSMPIIFNLTTADVDENGDPILVKNTVNFATQSPRYGVAIFSGLTYSGTDLSPYLDDLSSAGLDVDTRLLYQEKLQQYLNTLVPTETTYLVAAREIPKKDTAYSTDHFQNFYKVKLNLSQYRIQAIDIRDFKIFQKQATDDSYDGYGAFITNNKMYIFSFDTYDTLDERKVELITAYTKEYSLIFGMDYSPVTETLEVLAMAEDGSVHVEILAAKNIETEEPKTIFDVDVNTALFPNQKINLRPKNFMIYNDPEAQKRYLTFFSDTLKSLLAIPLEADILEKLSVIK